MSEDRILYHYTSVEGARSILASRSIWMSDCRFMNDRHELEKANDEFLSLLDGDTHSALSDALFWNNWRRYHCVFALSESAFILSQWRTYAADGTGIALGFIENLLTAPWCALQGTLLQCLYERHEEFIRDLVTDYNSEIKEIVRMYKSVEDCFSFWELIDSQPDPLDAITHQLLRLKNPAFMEEREVRLVVSVPRKTINTRSQNGVIIPYADNLLLPHGKVYSKLDVLVGEVWLGPKCDQRNSEAMFAFTDDSELVLRAQHYDCGYL